MIVVNSARAFIPISDLSVTAETGDISGDSSSRGQDTENGDCPRKPEMSGHPSIRAWRTLWTGEGRETREEERRFASDHRLKSNLQLQRIDYMIGALAR